MSRPAPVLCAVMVFALAVAPGCQRPDDVRIGFLGGLSGPLADLGVGGRNGAQLAVDTLNARGGTRYDLLVRDDRQDADTARQAVTGLAADGASFVVGPMTSAMAVAIVPVAERLGLVFITPSATTDELSGLADIFFRTAPAATTGARALAQQLRGRGVRSLAILTDASNRAYTDSFGHAAAQRFQALGGEVRAELAYTSGGSIDYAELARRVAQAGAEAALLVDSPGEAAIVAQHLHRIDPRVLIAVSPWAANIQFVQFGGRAVEGALALQPVDLDSPNPAMRDFVHRYRERFGEDPTTPAAQSYEAVMLGTTALARGGRGKGRLRETLAQPATWPGLDGDFTLDAHGEAQRRLHLVQVRHARFESLP